jgi:hypothetical protein
MKQQYFSLTVYMSRDGSPIKTRINWAHAENTVILKLKIRVANVEYMEKALQ